MFRVHSTPQMLYHIHPLYTQHKNAVKEPEKGAFLAVYAAGGAR